MQLAGQHNRRRLLVFLGTLSVALGVSLAYTWLRPAEYRAVARLEITPGLGSGASASQASNASGSGEPKRPFLTEVQVLVSRPVLEEVAARLQSAGEDLSAFGADAVGGMETHLQALPVADTHVVELVATGGRATLLAPLVNTVTEVYQSRLAESYRNSTGIAMAQADDEVMKLEHTVATKRSTVEDFRLRNNIVSLERDENEVLGRVRNLTTSLSAANDKVAAAEGKLHALSGSAASGAPVVRSKDDPTVASLEQRVSQLREELRDQERGFTPEYMAKDPKVVAQRARLAELERQLSEQRVTSRQTALLEAREELAAAQATATRLREQMAGGRQEVAQFTTRFNEYKALQSELDDLEKAYRDAIQRRAKLDASERERMPSLRVVEAGTTPEQPWRPLYWRDTAISVAGSLVLALLAMWLVELFNRPDPQPSVVLIQPQQGALRYEGPQLQALAERGEHAARLGGAEPALLPRQPRFPRELRQDEVAALVRAAEDEPRLAILLLLSGLDVDEVLALRWGDFDSARGVIHVGREFRRDIAVGAPLLQLLPSEGGRNEAEPVIGSLGHPATRDSIDAQILCAAHDAGIEEPAQVNADCVRHSYVAFLVRQGIRFADLSRIVGDLPPANLGAYSALSPPGMRLGHGQAQLLHPALRETTA